MGGYSELGPWARQVANEIIITRTDNDGDGMLDEWEAAYGVTDPDGDPDNDGLTNLQEFNQGKHPKRADAQSDGTILYEWANGNFGSCEGQCGGVTGYRYRDVWCQTQYGGTPVLDFYCGAGSRPASTQACVTDLCTPQPNPTGLLNDTGITTCSNASSNNLACPQSGYPGQDAEQGRDTTHNNNSDGHAGFSFTKLDANGNALPAGAGSWSCVKDNVTGLIWEVKTDDGGLRDKDWTYTWYNPDSNSNGGSAGTQNGGSCSGSGCDIQAYVQAVNGQGLCGASDWRMPTIKELEGIVSLDRINPAIESGYFPNTRSMDYWSASPHAYYSNGAWGVYFYYGPSSGYYYKSDYVYVRLVRDGQ